MNQYACNGSPYHETRAENSNLFMENKRYVFVSLGCYYDTQQAICVVENVMNADGVVVSRSRENED